MRGGAIPDFGLRDYKSEPGGSVEKQRHRRVVVNNRREIEISGGLLDGVVSGGSH